MVAMKPMMKPLKNASIFTRLLLLTAVLGIVPIVALAFLLVLPLNLSLDELRHLLGILLMAIPVAALCLAALSTKTIRSSLRKLLIAQRQFYSGDLGTRIPIEGDKDSINLYRGFNVMAELVQESTKRVVKEERTRALGIQASHVAHDMRSPLAVLKTYVGTEADIDSPDAGSFREAAQHSVDKLLCMADDLVDYAKASKVERSHTDIRQIISESVMAETKGDANSALVSVRCDKRGSLLANIDGYKIERVMVNLVRNAIQAMNNGGGEVALSARATPSKDLIIEVSDSGQGMDPEEVSHIFDSFYTKGKRSGTGLGLAYCKQVIDAHGGTIDVDSQLGRGTTFIIKMPGCVVDKA
jgi:signal transduction histidine kinase